MTEYKKFEDKSLPSWAPGSMISCHRLDCMKENYLMLDPVRKVDEERMKYLLSEFKRMVKNDIPCIITREKFKNACLYRLYVAGVDKETWDGDSADGEDEEETAEVEGCQE